MKHSFGSDNHSGVHPLIMEAVVKENSGFRTSYGADDYTVSVLEKLENLLGGDCKALFVLNGTGANVIALAPFLRSFNSILAPATAHINVDECGAPDKFTSSKIIPLQHTDGKVYPETVKAAFADSGDQHRSQPKILSISQPTELGTLYTPEEIKTLAELMHENGGYLHVDGSRISNAAAALNLPVKAITADCNIDSLKPTDGRISLLYKKAGNAALLQKQIYCSTVRSLSVRQSIFENGRSFQRNGKISGRAAGTVQLHKNLQKGGKQRCFCDHAERTFRQTA